MSYPHAPRTRFRFFDIRNIIGALLGIYGVLLTIAGFFPQILAEHSDPAAAGNRAQLYIGTDANWWVGLVLLGVSGVFIAWALLRPVVPDEPEKAPAVDGRPLES
jgi:H+/Cl- antiporter ClcA